MPIAAVAMPAYPSVPAAPGVPPVTRVLNVVGRVADVAILLAADAAFIRAKLRGPQWGIFDKYGRKVLVGDAVMGFDFRREYTIPDYPVEDGGFASYNKVARPADCKISFAVNGRGSLISDILSGGALATMITGIDSAQAGRSNFLSTLEGAAATISTFTAITPEFSYPNMNVIHFDYRREARNGGVSNIVFDVWLREVRRASTPTFSNTATPSGADVQSQGQVQSLAANTAQANAYVSAGAAGL